MLHGITQCYLPPGRGDIPALTPAEAGTRLSDPGGMQENRIFFLLPEAFCGLKCDSGRGYARTTLGEL